MSEQKLCGNCKYKGRPITGHYTDQPQYFLCDRIEQLNAGISTRDTHKAIVEDGSGYYAALCVSDEWGCIEWEAEQ